MTEQGTLDVGEIHPASKSAMDYLKSLPLTTLMLYQESYASCAIEGNRLGYVCSETIRRIMHNEPVSDRYLLGLAWSIRRMEEEKPITKKSSTKKLTRFVKPTTQQAAEYAKEIGFTSLDAQGFCDFYESKGWKVGKTPMKDWKAAVRTWKRSQKKETSGGFGY